MVIAGVDISGELVGAGTFLLGLGTFVTSLDNRRKAKNLQQEQAKIATAVNGVATQAHTRNEQLTAALVDADVAIPARPPEKAL
jgi:hypothetical protein